MASSPSRSRLRILVSRAGTRRLRTIAWLLIAATWVVLLGVMLWRGRAAGVDALAYWLGTRTWMAGGDPYVGTCPLCYAYAPWAVPLFAPWALLPWPLAFVLWRLVTVFGLAATTLWAARRRPLLSALLFLALSVPIGINLDTGNVTLPLVLLLWCARRLGPGAVGAAWGLATGLKWVTAPLWLLLSPAARRAGLAALAVTALGDLLLWTGTLRQVLTVAHMDRPFPFDYLVLIWAAVPWIWTDASLPSRLRVAFRWPQLAWRRLAWRRLARRRRPAPGVWSRGG
ncbi:MAG TPA: hypothetical protein VFK61_04960 [Candidatus Limnocylindria bacterium]|nr:hypothetical protein [Candidatus Limnocylindria bacterium]